MPYQRTTATNKLLELKKRIRGVSGGTSASKTVSILMILIDFIQSWKDNLTISTTSETMPHLKRGAMRDFLSIMQDNQYFEDTRWNKSDFIYDFSDIDPKTNKPINRKIFEFFSTDQPGKVRGPRRDIWFANEVNNISKDIFDQMEVRTKMIIWCDWNPVNEFFFYTDILPTRDDVDFLTLTYKDNEALDPAIVQAIEARKGNKAWWKVYGEGQLGEVEGKIYTNWQQIDEIPHEARLERRGLDFGYSNDPSAIVAIYYYNGGYILDEELYQKGLTNKQIADTLLNLPSPNTVVIADSAEPKSIDEIRLYGVNIIPTVKGKDSVTQGIQFVQQQQISFTKRSQNLRKEYMNYLWETDKDGKILNEPIGIFNHALDAVRYAFDGLREPAPVYVPPKNDLSNKDWSFS